MKKFDITKVRRSDFWLVLSLAGAALVVSLGFMYVGSLFGAVSSTAAFALLSFTAGAYGTASSRSFRSAGNPPREAGRDYFPDLQAAYPWLTPANRLRQGLAIIAILPAANFLNSLPCLRSEGCRALLDRGFHGSRLAPLEMAIGSNSDGKS